MLSAKKVAKELQKLDIKILRYEESKDPKFIDGEVTLEDSLSVQVGFDYACLCLVSEDGIDYLFEVEDIHNEVEIATQMAGFLHSRQP
jgi:hypothetical protein